MFAEVATVANCSTRLCLASQVVVGLVSVIHKLQDLEQCDIYTETVDCYALYSSHASNISAQQFDCHGGERVGQQLITADIH